MQSLFGEIYKRSVRKSSENKFCTDTSTPGAPATPTPYMGVTSLPCVTSQEYIAKIFLPKQSYNGHNS